MTTTTPLTQLERLRARFFDRANPLLLMELLDMETVEIESGRAVFRLHGGSQHANPMGTLHGGVLSTLADSAMGVAFLSTLTGDESFTTLELKINFLRPVRDGVLIAEGRVLNAGRTIGLAEASVTDAQGRLVAHATSTCMVLRGEQAAGRGVTGDSASRWSGPFGLDSHARTPASADAGEPTRTRRPAGVGVAHPSGHSRS